MHILNEIRLDFPALPENESLARMVVSAFLVPLNPTLEELADVKTAVSEAVTNAIVHGYGGKGGIVRLRADCREDGMITVDVSDKGRGIADIARARQPFFTTLGGEERSGMGFTVMESFMDNVEVHSAPGKGTVVRLQKQLNVREEILAQQA
ncbi:MAG: anti-sigma F factor [Clostridia bacterium]|nr:anti-sigma F factor [Clostridia bacterium]MBP3652984.1 anti-sigma F factor [Clostridia bacterium]